MEPLLLGSSNTTCPLANLACTIITAAAVASTTEDNNKTETNDCPRLLSSICACTPVHYGSKLLAPPTMGKLNIWLSGLLSAPLLSSTLDMLPKHTVLVARGDPGYEIHPRMSSMRSEEHTSELQSPDHLVCRLLLEKKKKNI